MAVPGTRVNVALQYRATPAAVGKYWDSLGRA
ncbi:hypothetical protein BCAR13_680011 [Paraburkholderia caribensis]|nr:hypothetical protein BCAR13_680011 [Paraburkholderia caribensis]